MHLLTEERVVNRRGIASSDHDADTGVVHSHKGFVVHFTVIFEKMVE